MLSDEWPAIECTVLMRHNLVAADWMAVIGPDCMLFDNWRDFQMLLYNIKHGTGTQKKEISLTSIKHTEVLVKVAET